MTRRHIAVAVVVGLVVIAGLLATQRWTGRDDADRVALPPQKDSGATAAFYADAGRPLVILAQRLERAPGDGGLTACRAFLQKDVDPLGTPDELTQLTIAVPTGPSQDAAVALMSSLRDYLAACGTSAQADAADDLRYQSIVSQRLIEAAS